MSAYDNVSMHRVMVADEVRTSAFRKCILATVQPGDVVVDVGAGSAILSMFAVQAGAARVYAIERAPGAVALARRVLTDNRMSDRVRIVDGPAESVRLPERADVIVSEWLGVFGIDENMLPAVLVTRDRWLKPGAKMIPGAVTSWMCPAWHPAGAGGTSLAAMDYGLDLSALAPFHPDQFVWTPNGVGPSDLRAEPQRLWVTDPRTMSLQEATRPFAAQLGFDVGGPVNCLVAWFSAELPGADILTNEPGAPVTHWGQFVFPIANSRSATAGDRLDVGFHCVPTPGGGSELLWAGRLSGGPLEAHDSRRVRRRPGMPPWRVHYDAADVASRSS